MVLMWDRFGYRLWGLGRDGQNLWLEVLQEHPLNAPNGCPITFKRRAFVALDLVFNGRVERYLHDFFFLVAESSSFSLSYGIHLRTQVPK